MISEIKLSRSLLKLHFMFIIIMYVGLIEIIIGAKCLFFIRHFIRQPLYLYCIKHRLSSDFIQI